jgi:phycocyanin-associated, rod
MTTTTVSNLTSNADRTVEIEVMGNHHQPMLRSSNYKLKIPYSSLSQTIRSIGQRGGKILSVKVLSNLMSTAALGTQIADAPAPVVAPVTTPEPAQPQANSKTNKDRHSSRRKHK